MKNGENQAVGTGAATETAAKAKKWHEEEGFKFEVGQRVKVIDENHVLSGRVAEITGPSAKKHAVKARLVHPKTGELQNTNVTIDYDAVELFTGTLETPANEDASANQAV